MVAQFKENEKFLLFLKKQANTFLSNLRIQTEALKDFSFTIEWMCRLIS